MASGSEGLDWKSSVPKTVVFDLFDSSGVEHKMSTLQYRRSKTDQILKVLILAGFPSA